MTKIHEIMETAPYTCQSTDTVGEVIRQLADAQIAGVPIVDEQQRLVGFISDGDIMRYISHKRAKIYDWGELMPVIIDEDPFEEKVKELLTKPVIEIASKKKIYAEVDQDIDEVADLFRREKVKKVAVLSGDKVVGVISHSSIIRHILTMILPDDGSDAAG
jgi:CBS domain-containing protein